ncbi:cytochrome c oxidase assembly protein [Mycolicibacterium sp.]|uniref:cytochrome c oxidase assembly protein n=1 Tax=Mycolicibacterium sp. TaxID=2320850 RepID=UPI003D11981E
MAESAAIAPAADPPLIPRSRLHRVVWWTVAVLAALTIPMVTVLLSGAAPYERIFRGFPGFDVAVATAVLSVGANAAGMFSVGAMIWMLFLRDATARQARTLGEGIEARVLRWASTVWAACAGALVVFSTVDANGVPLIRLAEPGALAYLYQGSYFPGAWTVTFVVAMVVCVAAWFAYRWTGLLIPLWASMFGLLAPVVVGQVLVGPDHDFGSDAAIVQTLAVNVGFGGITVATLRVASGRLVPIASLRRLFLIAAVSLPVIVATDVVIALFKLSGTGLLASVTGWQILARWAVLAVLLVLAVAVAGWWRRGRLSDRRIARLLTIASISIAAWVGVGIAMTRIPPPQYFVPTSISQVFMGFEVPDAPTTGVLFTAWRPNLLFLGLAIAAVTVYLLAVRSLRRRGDAWPVGRTVSWLLGWTTVVLATSSGFGKYSAPDFGVHMIVHMSLNMLAPGLLVLGGVVTLLLRATRTNPGGIAGPHDWITWVLHWRVLRFVYNPLVVFVVFIGSYYGLYLTGIFGEFMRFHWAHQFMNLHFLIVGYLYYSLIIGVDRPPRPLPHIGKLGYVLAAMPFHAFFGIILMTGAETQIIAENFYQYLDLPWADLPAQQYLGGGVAWAGGEIPLMIVIVILAIQWGRQDAKEAKRKDRHLDTGRDDEYDAYNQMLARLAERQTIGPRRQPSDQKEPQP